MTKTVHAHLLQPGDVIRTEFGDETVRQVCVLDAPAGPVAAIVTDRTEDRLLPHLFRTVLVVDKEDRS
jgi:hypothetical protein